MMTIGLILLGMCVGASVMLVLCRRDAADAVQAAAAGAARQAFARGYEEGVAAERKRVQKPPTYSLQLNDAKWMEGVSAAMHAVQVFAQESSIPPPAVIKAATGAVLVTDVHPTKLEILATKWVREGRRLNCHAWLAALPLGAAMTDDEAWCTMPFWARVTVFIVVVFLVSLWGAVIVIKDRDPGGDEDASRREEFFRKLDAERRRTGGQL